MKANNLSTAPICIDHVTLRTRDLHNTRKFFIDVFDLEEQERPAAIQRIPGHWLYQGENPIVHLIGSYGQGSDRAAEAIDHVGFRLQNHPHFIDRLKKLQIPHSLMDLPELEERRVFLRAPGGPLLEAVFHDSTFSN